VRTTIDRLMSGVYWSIHNRTKGTFVASSHVSRKASIGRHCWIRQGVEVHDNVSLGDYSYVIGPDTLIDEAAIGKFCSIARNVIIGPVGHHHEWVSTHPFIYSAFYGFVERDKPIPQKSAPVIGNDVWIGMNSVILRGVEIGHGAVIAAGSVVTHNVEPYSIVAGVPARQIKHRFPEEVRRALLELKWWDWGDDRLREALPCLCDVDGFLARYGRGTRPTVGQGADNGLLADEQGTLRGRFGEGYADRKGSKVQPV